MNVFLMTEDEALTFIVQLFFQIFSPAKLHFLFSEIPHDQADKRN